MVCSAFVKTIYWTSESVWGKTMTLVSASNLFLSHQYLLTDNIVCSPSVRIVAISFSVDNLLSFTDFYIMNGIISFNKICSACSMYFIHNLTLGHTMCQISILQAILSQKIAWTAPS